MLSQLHEHASSRLKLPPARRWKYLISLFSKRERTAFLIFAVAFSIGVAGTAGSFYITHTQKVPAHGGTFTEGLVGQPRFVNPLYAPASDTDRDLTELVFSGLFSFTPEGTLTPELAKEYTIKDEGRAYEVTLRDDISWSDGEPITAHDVVFTVNAAKSSEYRSPLRANWLGVDAEAVTDILVRFTLQTPYHAFLENLTLKPVPAHIFEEIAPENASLSSYNLKPVGSGPYVIAHVDAEDGRISSMELERNPHFHHTLPYLEKIAFVFFNTEQELLDNASRLSGFMLRQQDLQENARELEKFREYRYSIPRYFAVFFNQDRAPLFEDERIRKALRAATNKERLVEKVTGNEGVVVRSPLLPEFYGIPVSEETPAFSQERALALFAEAGFEKNEEGMLERLVRTSAPFQFTARLQKGSRGAQVQELQRCLARFPDVYPEQEVTGIFGELTEQAVNRFQEKYAEEILAPGGLTRGTGLVAGNTRAKLNELCFPDKEERSVVAFSLMTVNQPELVEAASFLAEEWKKVGVQVDVVALESRELQEAMRAREYEALLFGNVLGIIPDPYGFWHSGQVRDPGLNLAMYENEDVDELLEELRLSQEREEREKILEGIQRILISEAPALFLWRPSSAYFVSSDVRGVKEGILSDPSKRFRAIAEWYVHTKRSWKE